ncbi:MAG: HIT domain-containing protein [Pseudomonadota bacterium]
MNEFDLDRRLAQDTLFVGSLETSDLLLMNDSRWFWLVLVPRIEDAVEWHELHTDQRQDIDFEVANVAAVLKGMSACKKVNIASLGNVVSQLHIHIVARNEDDENWPRPVWGVDGKVPYHEDASDQIIEVLKAHLDLVAL